MVKDVTQAAHRNDSGTANPEEESSLSSAGKMQMTSATSHLCERDTLPAWVPGGVRRPRAQNEIRSAGDRADPWQRLLRSQTCCCRRLPALSRYTVRVLSNGDGRDLRCVTHFIRPRTTGATNTNPPINTDKPNNTAPVEQSDTTRSHYVLCLGFLPSSVTTRVAIVQQHNDDYRCFCYLP